MLVYKDIITGDEMLSDAYKLLPVVDSEGNTVEGLMMVESKMVTEGGGDIDIGCGNSFGGGDEDGGVDDNSQNVNNVIAGFQYTETQLGSAAEFKGWIKDYMNAIRAKMREKGKPKEEIQAFMALAPNIAKFFLKNFSEVQFYLGPSFNPDSMVFSIYPDGATTPNFYYIMPGLVEEKF
eukprot:TRINITY_DN70370_c0_g1_i1.p1 TRINITY_DN70370_c0_g1~~TRINITY_DN70370_c0_g1_i1.p1  ORF type:complete len:179 (-),score=11.65 TRINITY_DN70370_c0_g1_i1:89-625(-)